MTPNMNLILPTPGVDPGPDYAQENNTSFTSIDSHDHTPGKGVPITPSGLSITIDLDFLQHNAVNLRAARFVPQTSLIPAVAPDLNEVYVQGVDLYYIDGNGNNVRITQGGSVTGATGTITGLPSGTAGAAYSSIAKTFIFSSATGVPANLDAGSVLLRDLTTPTNAVTLAAPNSLAASYTLTMPPSLPGSQQLLQVGTSGNMVASNAIVGAFSSSGLASLNSGLTVTGATLGSTTITAGTDIIATNNVIVGGPSGAALANRGTDLVAPNGVFFGGTTNRVSLSFIGAGFSNALYATYNLSIPRTPILLGGPDLGYASNLLQGNVDSAGNIVNGQGFSVIHSSTGVYTITFNRAFNSNMSITATPITSGGFIPLVGIQSVSSASAVLNFFSTSSGPGQDTAFSFIAVGEWR